MTHQGAACDAAGVPVGPKIRRTDILIGTSVVWIHGQLVVHLLVSEVDVQFRRTPLLFITRTHFMDHPSAIYTIFLCMRMFTTQA